MVAITVTGITQDEALDGAGEGNTCPDATGVGTATASLRAEREGGGDGGSTTSRSRAMTGEVGAARGP